MVMLISHSRSTCLIPLPIGNPLKHRASFFGTELGPFRIIYGGIARERECGLHIPTFLQLSTTRAAASDNERGDSL